MIDNQHSKSTLCPLASTWLLSVKRLICVVISFRSTVSRYYRTTLGGDIEHGDIAVFCWCGRGGGWSREAHSSRYVEMSHSGIQYGSGVSTLILVLESHWECRVLLQPGANTYQSANQARIETLISWIWCVGARLEQNFTHPAVPWDQGWWLLLYWFILHLTLWKGTACQLSSALVFLFPGSGGAECEHSLETPLLRAQASKDLRWSFGT